MIPKSAQIKSKKRLINLYMAIFTVNIKVIHRASATPERQEHM